MPDPISTTRIEQLPLRTQQVVFDLCDGLLDIFDTDLAAIWLYGAALFTPHALDIDLHIVLRQRPSSEEGEDIEALHTEISSGLPFSDEIDSWYVLLEDAQRPEPPQNVGPWNPGPVDSHWALHRAHWLAGACIVVYGLTPDEVVAPPSWDELEQELRREAADPEATSSYSAYWTLQLCRVLASLETRDVVRSKLDSGKWALQQLPEDAHIAIVAAMQSYSAGAADFRMAPEYFTDFLEAIRPRLDAALARQTQ
jgi:hypothetical protein